MPFSSWGKMLIILGLFLVVIGLILKSGFKIPFLGHLPGDVFIENEHVKLYIPLGTSLLLSLLISLVLYLINRFK